jgi:hypothetical protein
MNFLRWSRALGALACAGMLLPPSWANAGEPVVSPSRVNSALAIEDVALGDNQSFQGVVLAENGQSMANTEVVISQLGREVARTTTDESGRFGFQGLRSGLHLARAGQGGSLFRFWAAGTAPPHARRNVTLVDRVTVRGQRPFRELFTSNAFILTGIVVAAIAIPIAVHDARNDKSGS